MPPSKKPSKKKTDVVKKVSTNNPIKKSKAQPKTYPKTIPASELKVSRDAKSQAKVVFCLC